MTTLILEPREVLTLYGLLQGCIDRMGEVENEMIDPQGTRDCLTNIMWKIKEELEK